MDTPTKKARDLAPGDVIIYGKEEVLVERATLTPNGKVALALWTDGFTILDDSLPADRTVLAW